MDTYNLPDMNAPRTITRNYIDLLEHCYFDQDRQILTGYFYKRLKSQFPHLSKYTNFQIKGFIKRFSQAIMQLSIDHIDGVALPYKCGIVMACTFGRRTGGIDRQASLKAGKKIYHSNFHSDGMGCGIYYTAQSVETYNTKSIPMYKNSYFWRFEPNIPYKRTLAKAYKTDWKKYRVLTKNRKYRELDDKKYVYKSSRINNEFDF